MENLVANKPSAQSAAEQERALELRKLNDALKNSRSKKIAEDSGLTDSTDTPQFER
jgi:hypothetical protein